MALRDPAGQTFITGCVINGTGGIDGAVLPTTGQYTLVVDPAQRHIGQIRLRLRG